MKNLKSIVIAILCLIPATSAYAQSNSSEKFTLYRDNVLLIEHDLGVNINTFKPKGNPAAELMGDRSNVGYREGTRISYLFAPRWGAYLSSHMSVYDIEHPYVEAEDIFGLFGINIPEFHIDVEAGIIYRIEHKRWQFYPRLGLGWNNITKETVKYKSSNGDCYGEIDIRPFYFSLSINAAYRVSDLVSWVLDISYHQPITESKSSLVRDIKGDDYMFDENYAHKTHRWGRDINVALGLRLNLNLGSSGK